MPFNSTDFTKAPWQSGIMTLTHEECVHVITVAKEIEENYDPSKFNYDPVSDIYVQAEYNKVDWTKGVNGETYAVLMQYDVEINKLGINEQGIVQEEIIEEETEEEIVEETIEESEEEIIEDTPVE